MQYIGNIIHEYTKTLYNLQSFLLTNMYLRLWKETSHNLLISIQKYTVFFLLLLKQNLNMYIGYNIYILRIYTVLHIIVK